MLTREKRAASIQGWVELPQFGLNQAIGVHDEVAVLARHHRVIPDATRGQRRGSRGGAAGSQRRSANNKVVDKLVVRLAIAVLAARHDVPDTDTTKGNLVLVLVDQGCNLTGSEVARASGILASRDTNEDLGILARRRLQVGDPGVEVVVINTMAARVVIELDEERVELALLDDGLHLKPLVAQGALRGRRQKEALAGLLGDQVTQPPDHGDIAGLVVCGQLVSYYHS